MKKHKNNQNTHPDPANYSTAPATGKKISQFLGTAVEWAEPDRGF